MLYDVETVANKLKVSKVTIYNKLKLKRFKDKVIIKAGKTMIDDELLNLIKDSIKFNTKLNTNDNKEQQENTTNIDNTIINDEIINVNKELINVLLEQLREKDKQISELHKLIENNQVLLREKPQSIKQLEEHFKDMDIKLLDIKEKMKQKRSIQNQKSFFERFFKK